MSDFILTLDEWATKQEGHASDIFNDVFADIKKWAGISDNTFTAPIFFEYIRQKYGDIIFNDYSRNVLTMLTRVWHQSNYYKFEGLYNTTIQEYNPIENYNRVENETVTNTPDITETETATHTPDTTETITENRELTEGGTTGTVSSGESEITGGIAPFDSSVFANAENSNGETSGTETITHGKTVTEDNGISRTFAGSDETETERTKTGTDTTERESTIHGNIGVMSTQDMLKAERAIVNFNILHLYISEWVHAFSAGIWHNSQLC